MTASPVAIVVGAGIGGLAAAIALRRAGWKVHVYERTSSPRELGFGLLLAPNAMAALAELGLGDAITAPTGAAGVELRRIDGTVIRRFTTSLGGPTVVALRPELHGALLHAVGKEALQLGSDVVSFEADADGVTVVCRDGRRDRGTILIGADGISSVVRKQLHPQEPPPRASGYCAVRGVAFGVSHQLGPLSAVGYFDAGIEAATVRAGRGDAIYWYMSLLAEEVSVEMRTPQAVLRHHLPYLEPRLQAILTATADHDMRFDALLQRDRLPSWGDGRTTLLGDAAHPVLPHTGQGAAQALEDAVALGLVLSPDVAIEPALRRYETVRRQRTNRFIQLGPRLARMTTTRSRLIGAVRSLGVRLVPERLVDLSVLSLGKDPHQALRSRSA
jgi:2-polyprenyl-6-methoxyphenol hydroxylase-like FAD-dependent oxidoreductase